MQCAQLSQAYNPISEKWISKKNSHKICVLLLLLSTENETMKQTLRRYRYVIHDAPL